MSHTLSRRFFWADNALWKEDIKGHRVGIALAGKDIVVDTKAIGAYLMGSEDWVGDRIAGSDIIWKGDGLEVMWFEDLDHGQIFKTKSTRRHLVQIVKDFCQERVVAK